MVVLLGLHACLSESPGQAGSKFPEHQYWTALLKKHVDENGFVDYRGFKNDSLRLQDYLDELQRHPPDKNSWSKKTQIAYWINVYNAFTVKLIIDHYPLESIKDITKGVQIPFLNSPWDIKFIEIGGQKLDLNNVEHGILRKKFDEPRIHFAINCASFSCPKLRNEAYIAEALDRQLDEQTREFINDSERNEIKEDHAEVSRIFSWFKGDFTKEGSLRDFLNKYALTKINNNAKINYLEYDWSLNAQ